VFYFISRSRPGAYRVVAVEAHNEYSAVRRYAQYLQEGGGKIYGIGEITIEEGILTDIDAGVMSLEKDLSSLPSDRPVDFVLLKRREG